MHQVHLDAYQRITLLSLIVTGESFSVRGSGLGNILIRYFEQDENQRVQMDGLGGMQDGSGMMEEVAQAQIGRALVAAEGGGNQWHWDLITAWETNDPEKMQETVAKSFDVLKGK